MDNPIEIDRGELWQVISEALFYVRSAHFYARNSKGEAAKLGVLSCERALSALYVAEDVLSVAGGVVQTKGDDSDD